jgi:hypothetical protein
MEQAQLVLEVKKEDIDTFKSSMIRRLTEIRNISKSFVIKEELILKEHGYIMVTEFKA